MLKASRYVFLFMIVLFLSTVPACSHSSSTDTGDNTASVTVSIGVQTPAQAVQKFLGTFTDVASLTVDAWNGGIPVITGQHVTYSNGVWSRDPGKLAD